MSEIDSSLELSTSLTRHHVRVFKIVVIGDSGVGKTSLTYRWCAGKFPGKTEATIGVDFREKVIETEGETIKLQLWDTAGQERFRGRMVEHYYRDAHGVLLVYDVTNASSFHSLPIWAQECRRHLWGLDLPRLLVGNKSDLSHSTQVPVDQAQEFARANRMQFFQTSAKDPRHGDEAEAVFRSLARKLTSRSPPGPSPPPGGEGAVSLYTEEGGSFLCSC